MAIFHCAENEGVSVRVSSKAQAISVKSKEKRLFLCLLRLRLPSDLFSGLSCSLTY